MRAAAASAATGSARHDSTPSGASAPIDGGRGGGMGGAGRTASAGADSFADAGSSSDGSSLPFSSALAAAQTQSSAASAGTGTEAAGIATEGSSAVQGAASAPTSRPAAGDASLGRAPAHLRSDGDALSLSTGLQRGSATSSTASASTRVQTPAADGADPDSAGAGSAGPDGTSAAAIGAAMSGVAVDASLADAVTAAPSASAAEDMDAGTPASGRADKRDAGSDGTSTEQASDATLAALALLFGANAGAVVAATAAAGSAPAASASGHGAGATLTAVAAKSYLASNAGYVPLALDADGPPELPLSLATLAGGDSGMSGPVDDVGSGAARSAGDTGTVAAGVGTGGTAGTSGSGAAAGSTVFGLLQNLTPVPGASTAVPAQSTLAVPVSDPSWPHALAAQVQWLATRQIQSATLRLTPEHLGPLEVRIEVAHSQVNVNFSAHHAETREALAQAVPRLRELFNTSGLNLGQATVGQQAQSGERSAFLGGAAQERNHETVEPVANTTVHRLGLIDEYA